MPDEPSDPSKHHDTQRRSFLSKMSSLTMLGGLVAGYGTFVHVAGRFLYPAREPRTSWLFVATVDSISPGTSKVFKTPGGTSVTIARRSEDAGGEFLALSSICPHLGCQVRWEAKNTRFFCPCHNGVFDPEGKPVSGPPADAGQSLAPYRLKIDRGLLYIGLREDVADASDAVLEDPSGPPGPGHDPVLFERGEREV